MVSMMLGEVIKITRLTCGEISGHRKHRNIEVRELLTIRRQYLPEPIIAWVIQPAYEDRIVLSIESSQVSVAPSAAVPLLIERAPLRRIVAAVVRDILAFHLQRPPVRGVLEDAALHGKIDAGRDGRGGRNGLQRRGRPFGGSP